MSNPLLYTDPFGLYIPQANDKCRVVILADHTFFTGQTTEKRGDEYTFNLIGPFAINTPWSSAPDIALVYKLTYHSMDYTRFGLFKNNINYLYVCDETDECGNTTSDSTFGYESREWWEEMESGTYRWLTSDVKEGQPYPVPDPNQGSGPPPVRIPSPRFR